MALKNFDVEMKGLDGESIQNEGKPILMRDIISSALLDQVPNENIPGDKKAERYTLALQIFKGGDQELKPEQLTLIKDIVGKTRPPLVVGQIYKLLDA